MFFPMGGGGKHLKLNMSDSESTLALKDTILLFHKSVLPCTEGEQVESLATAVR